jgi:hypothetical protein
MVFYSVTSRIIPAPRIAAGAPEDMRLNGNPEPPAEPAAPRAITVRAVFLGFLGVLFVTAFAYANDLGMGKLLTKLVGTHLPVFAYSLFFLFIALVNPLLARWGRRRWFAVALICAVLLFSFALVWLFRAWWPLVLFGALLAVAVLGALRFGWNPLRPFAAGELVVMLALTLVACSLPTAGLMRWVPPLLVLPEHYGKDNTDWNKTRPLQYLDPNLFPLRDPDNLVYTDFYKGFQDSPNVTPLSETSPDEWMAQTTEGWARHADRVPWGAWTGLREGESVRRWIGFDESWNWVGPLGPMWRWMPIFIVLMVFMLSLCRVTHRQWSEHEQLAYPIAEFGNALLKNERGRMFSDIFYSRLFWIGLGVILVIHLINGVHAYVDRMIQIPIGWDVRDVCGNLAIFQHVGGNQAYFVCVTLIYFAAVGFAYFMPTDISFSLGITSFAFVLVSAASYACGRELTGSDNSHFKYGALFVMTFMILWLGRRYFGSVLLRAFFFRAKDTVDIGAVRSCRWFLLSSAVLALLFWRGLGMDWLISILVVLILAMIFLVVARISAETGMYVMLLQLTPQELLTAALGPAALGPASLYTLPMVSTMVASDTRESLPPFASNAFRLAGLNRVPIDGLRRWMIVALVAGLFVSAAAVLWVVYDKGIAADANGERYPRELAANVSKSIGKIRRSEGLLDQSVSASGFERIGDGLRESKPGFWTMAAIGAAVVAANSLVRLRFVWWPIHSVLFIFWGTAFSGSFAWSFLFGWLAKTLTLKIGGGRAYHQLKPLFIGLILGELLAGIIMLVVGHAYFWWTGDLPKYYALTW